MPILSKDQIEELLEPYLKSDQEVVSLRRRTVAELSGPFSSYLELLLRWNARTNLTSVRGPQAIVQRHFGESLFAAAQLGPFLRDGATVLDLGSGAGFPGVPVQLLYPTVYVTLAESQGKKAAFLREVTRALGLPCQVWADRVEALPEEQRFDVVTLRAVDRMEEMVAVGERLVAPRGVLLEMTVKSVAADEIVPIPNTSERVVALRRC